MHAHDLETWISNLCFHRNIQFVAFRASMNFLKENSSYGTCLSTLLLNIGIQVEVCNFDDI